jgi:phage host-nuclease inhibitor protein Gam
MPKRKVVVNIPKDLHEAAFFLAQIGEAERASLVVQANLNAQVDTLKASAIAAVKPHQVRMKELLEGLYIFAERNRTELTEGGKRKSVELPTGIIGWRMTPPSVELEGVENIIESLKTLKLERFIRTKEEVNKEAMLREPEIATTVQGVTITQKEEFMAKPAQLEVEIVTRATKHLKKFVKD